MKALLLATFLPLLLSAQTTQGVISGVVLTAKGEPIGDDKVHVFIYSCLFAEDGSVAAHDSTKADSRGFYVLPDLSPGDYRLRADARTSDTPAKAREGECFSAPDADAEFQAQEKHDLTLGVAARMNVDFALRKSKEVWDSNAAQYLTPSQLVVRYFGADDRTMKSIALDTAPASQQTSGTTVSYDISPGSLERLPLQGRDTYALLTLLPGVTADTATGRGLGFSVNGQRPSSSNYMLDGAENNNYLLTGPLTPVAPEALQEYRISTNNFSAEFGRTSGFLANAITKSGGASFHGIGYLYLMNEVLNAADFQENLLGQPRTPIREIQPGFVVTGPILSKRLYFSGSFEYFRYRSRLTPKTVYLPTTQFLLNQTAPLAHQLLQAFPSPFDSASGPIATVTVAPTSSLNRTFATPRLDYSPNEHQHITGRLALASYDQPDAGWSPYPQFLTPLTQSSQSLVVNVTSSLRTNMTNQARIAWSSIDFRYDQAHPEIPLLSVTCACSSVPGSIQSLTVPSTPSFYSLHDRNRVWQFADNFLWSTPRHQVKIGGGAFLRALDNYLKIAPNGWVRFDQPGFQTDSPQLLTVPVSRNELYSSPSGSPNLQVPNFDRNYRAADFFAFAQDSFKVTPRFTLDYGLRYEFFGPPVNTGTVKDGLLQLGSGATLLQQITTAHFVFPAGGGQQMYSSDPKDWGARLGFAYSLDRRSSLSLRGAYGIFYDRPFDNLWENLRNNSVILASRQSPSGNYLLPVSSQLQDFSGLNRSDIDQKQPLYGVLYQPGLKNGRVQSYFLSLQKQFSNNFAVELNGLGSLGQKLIATDLLNRSTSTNPALPQIAYRSNLGSSQYNALTAVARYRGTHAQVQASYTWSHSIDNQSDPLAGEFDFTDLSKGGSGLNGIAAFSRQFDWGADRGNSDFDQRHNLVFFSVWDLPALLSGTRAGVLFRNWRISELAAVRSGLPYSVLATESSDAIINKRADIVNPQLVHTSEAIAGGMQLLNLAAFAAPANGSQGNSGRNAFAGPGLFNADLSLARVIFLPRLKEGARLVLRADAFNFLNHANLNNPYANISLPKTADIPPKIFGQAMFGRQEQNTGFPLLTPLHESARQIQLLLRVEF